MRMRRTVGANLVGMSQLLTAGVQGGSGSPTADQVGAALGQEPAKAAL